MSGALAAGRRLRIRYVTAADEASEREIDPVSLHTQDEHAYLLAWCHRARGRRTFRVDRVLDATVLDVPVEQHDVDPDVDFTPAGDAPVATIVLASPARAVAEQVPVESVRDLPDGSFEVRLRVTNPVWLRRLLLARAPHVLSVEPASVAQDVRQAARAALTAYERLPGSLG
ncbi:helix-turn-helix transcriptional regulator [Cellulosimicrobium sp. CUA-896]|uniref:helix-turn-helix transcriptional regulator n=1 Tax=Cellulosimicrobium sp. CUA-896 TaxID=1517881 RepID=UPI000A4331B0